MCHTCNLCIFRESLLESLLRLFKLPIFRAEIPARTTNSVATHNSWSADFKLFALPIFFLKVDCDVFVIANLKDVFFFYLGVA